ncbi:hypothetical protein FLM55_03810 [Francisella sp. Scap27]|uniref:hypothetical protein n=1 Tax=Francisella sp. Scap27 TaxID=2589986 RepID=UPI0015BDFD61|nr:hypothetical protein [Francisella sp. Scap27]QLE78909.1 hypothetical protein FLM55_03810 [Francisella sp. Scap27]
MNIARYKKGFINTSEYSSKLHSGNIYCLDCGKAKVKIIRKANQGSFFEVIKDEDNLHDDACPRVAKLVDEARIKELLNSDSKKDMSKINFLVNKNLEKTINLLTKLEVGGELRGDETLELMPQKKQHLANNKIKEYVKQDIATINALELTEENAASLNGKYRLIYGISGISKSLMGDSVKMLFKVNQDARFSIFIAPNQVQYLDFDKSKIAKFAVFGRIKKTGKFTNIEIRSTRDMVIVD